MAKSEVGDASRGSSGATGQNNLSRSSAEIAESASGNKTSDHKVKSSSNGISSNQEFKDDYATTQDVQASQASFVSAALVIVDFFDLVNFVEIIDDQEDLLNDYFEIAEEDFLFWDNNYRPFLQNLVSGNSPNFTGLLNQAPYNPDYVVVESGVVSKAFRENDLAWRNKRRVTDVYNTGTMRWDDITFSMQTLVGLMNGYTFARRFEDTRKEMFEDRAWSRLRAVMNVGIEGGNIAIDGLGRALVSRGEAAVEKQEAFSSIIGGVAGAVSGMQGRRNEAQRTDNGLGLYG